MNAAMIASCKSLALIASLMMHETFDFISDLSSIPYDFKSIVNYSFDLLPVISLMEKTKLTGCYLLSTFIEQVKILQLMVALISNSFYCRLFINS